MWIGESERKLHELFQHARRIAPCVLFFDEVDALGRRRTQLRESGGREVVVQFLAELDSFGADNEGVFVLAATNHPWDVDPALRRPGRFDRTLLVLPPDEPARRRILEVHLREKPVGEVDIDALARGPTCSRARTWPTCARPQSSGRSRSRSRPARPGRSRRTTSSSRSPRSGRARSPGFIRRATTRVRQRRRRVRRSARVPPHPERLTVDHTAADKAAALFEMGRPHLAIPILQRALTHDPERCRPLDVARTRAPALRLPARGFAHGRARRRRRSRIRPPRKSSAPGCFSTTGQLHPAIDAARSASSSIPGITMPCTRSRTTSAGPARATSPPRSPIVAIAQFPDDAGGVEFTVHERWSLGQLAARRAQCRDRLSRSIHR